MFTSLSSCKQKPHYDCMICHEQKPPATQWLKHQPTTGEDTEKPSAHLFHEDCLSKLGGLSKLDYLLQRCPACSPFKQVVSEYLRSDIPHTLATICAHAPTDLIISGNLLGALCRHNFFSNSITLPNLKLACLSGCIIIGKNILNGTINNTSQLKQKLLPISLEIGCLIALSLAINSLGLSFLMTMKYNQLDYEPTSHNVDEIASLLHKNPWSVSPMCFSIGLAGVAVLTSISLVSYEIIHRTTQPIGNCISSFILSKLFWSPCN